MKIINNMLYVLIFSGIFISCEFSSISPQNFTGTRYALLAGLEYQNEDFYSDEYLYYTADDARTMKEALQEIGFSHKHISMLTSDIDAVTADDLLEKLDEIFLELTPDDLMVFYFAGHGETDEEGFFLIDEKREEIRDIDLLQRFIDAPCPVIVILDACHSGALIPPYPYSTNITELANDLGATHPISESIKLSVKSYFQHHDDHMTYSDLWFITAAGRSEFSHEPEYGEDSYDSLGNLIENGLFTHYLTLGLSSSSGFLNADGNRDGVLLLSELYEYIEASYQANMFFGQSSPHTSGTPRDIILYSY